MTSPVLAVSCGPSIATWDLAQSTKYQSNNNLFDAKELSQYNHSIIDYDTGISTFQPHGPSQKITGFVWNHNGQVIASCSDSTLVDSPYQNVVLTHYQTKTKLESFSNVPDGNNIDVASPCTSISFGGKIAKSRYLCVSDAAGLTSIWDMKKIHRVRCFKSKRVPRPGVIRACIDPTDTFVASLHGSIQNHNPTVLSSNIVLELFHLKTGALSMTLEAKGYQYGGAAHCFQFSELDPNHIIAGTENGSLLLWDITSHRDRGNVSAMNSIAPLSTWTEKHSQAITDVVFSPIHSNLAATCSTDGTIAFHDLDSKTIQTVKPWEHATFKIPVSKTRQGLTALAFHHDGYTWAAGTQDGLLFMYDLRQTEAGPLAMMDVDRDLLAPVSCVRFMPPSIGGNKVMPSSKVTTSLEVHSPIPTYSSSHANNEMNSSATRNVPTNNKTPSIISEKEGETIIPTSIPSPQPSITISDNTFVSPIANISKSSTSSQKKESAVKFKRNVHVHIPETKVTSSKIDVDDSEKQQQDQIKMMESMDDMLNRIRSRSLEIQKDDPKDDLQSLQKEMTSFASTSVSQSISTTNIVMQDQNTEFQSSEMLTDQKRDPYQSSQKMISISSLQLQEMIEEAVESLRDDIEQKIQMIQGEFFRELQLQASETYELLEKQQQRVEKLILENAELKEENAKLKSFF